MKTPAPLVAFLFVLGLVAQPDARAQQPEFEPIFEPGAGPEVHGHPDEIGRNLARLLRDELDLTFSQRSQAEVIYTNEMARLQALGSPALRKPAETYPIRMEAMNQIRALLTPEQRGKFNLLPQYLGGGLKTLSPWDRLDKLDKLVHLTDTQKNQALQVYILAVERFGEMDMRAERGKAIAANRDMREHIAALLTPAQRAVWEVAPQTEGGGSTAMPAARMLARLEKQVHLDRVQKDAALRIYTDLHDALSRIPEAERPEKGKALRQAATEKVRALLTADQLQIFDSKQKTRSPS